MRDVTRALEERGRLPRVATGGAHADCARAQGRLIRLLTAPRGRAVAGVAPCDRARKIHRDAYSIRVVLVRPLRLVFAGWWVRLREPDRSPVDVRQFIWISRRVHQPFTDPVHSELPMKRKSVALGFVAIGGVICAAGIYLGETDDAPGAALLGISVLIAAMVFSVRIARGRA